MMYTFQVKGKDYPFQVVSLHGYEGISELFQVHIRVDLSGPRMALQEVLGRPACLSIASGETIRYIHGIVSRFEQHNEPTGPTTYQATLVPDVWRLLHRQDNRIFHGLSVPEIINLVLRAFGIAGQAVRLALTQTYRVRDCCVQYQESDWAFISRLMEDEGIHYFFEHSAEGHTLVIADGSTAHRRISGKGILAFQPSEGLSNGASIVAMDYIERLRPGKVTLCDYALMKPAVALDSEVAVADAQEALHIIEYPGGYTSPEAGRELAQKRLDELQQARKVVRGRSNCPYLAAGRLMQVTGHPEVALNQGYLLTRVRHEGRSAGSDPSGNECNAFYKNRFRAIPAGVSYRPLRRTPRPRIQGIQTATVVGPAGEQVYTDAYGRVKVRFHWDRQGEDEVNNLCWVPVAQAWAGGGHGVMFVPRVGHEVVVAFIDGNPERPLVIGSMYHATHRPPCSLPRHKAVSVIRTSSMGGEGYNEIRFEDGAGQEKIHLQAQRDYTELILNNQSTTVGSDQTTMVGGHQQGYIGGDQSLNVDGHQQIRVQGSQRIRIEGTTAMEGMEGAYVNVTGGYEVEASKSVTVSAADSIRLGCGKSLVVIEPERIVMTVGAVTKVVALTDVEADLACSEAEG